MKMRNYAGNVSHAAAEGTNEYTRIRFKELGFRLLSNWYWILGAALALSIIMAVVSIYLITPMYQATATIYVLDTQNGVTDLSVLQAGEALTQDYLNVFSMWEVHDKVRSDLGLHYSYGDMDEMISVRQAQGSRMVDITISSPDASEAAAMANRYAEVSSEFISEKMKTEKPCIVSSALMPTAPSSPSTLKNIALGFVLGAFFAAAFVVMRVIFDDRIKTAEDIERYTGLLTLAVVPLQTK